MSWRVAPTAFGPPLRPRIWGVVGCEVGALAAGRGPRRLRKGLAELPRAGSRPPGTALASGAVVARADPGPRG